MSTHSSHNVSKRFCKTILFLFLALLIGGCGSSLNPIILKGDTAQAKTIIMQGEGIEEKDQMGRTPLMNATIYGHLELVDLLIQKGANIEATDKSEETPLIFAAQRNDPTILEFLIKKGADINATNGHGQTPLMVASSRNSFELVKVLVEAGADVNEKNAKDDPTLKNGKESLGGSALYSAISIGSEHIADYLIEHGAKENGAVIPAFVDDELGMHTYLVAVSHESYAKYLAKKGNFAETKKHYAEAVNYFEKASEILKEKTLDLRAGAGYTAILRRFAVGIQSLPELNENLAKTYSDKAIEALVNSRKCQKILECYKKMTENDSLGKCQEGE